MTTVQATENTTIDRAEFVGPFRHLQIRWATTYTVDGETLGEPRYHRRSYAPGSDVSDLPEPERKAAAAMWTQEVIDAYNAQIEAQQSTA